MGSAASGAPQSTDESTAAATGAAGAGAGASGCVTGATMAISGGTASKGTHSGWPAHHTNVDGERCPA